MRMKAAAECKSEQVEVAKQYESAVFANAAITLGSSRAPKPRPILSQLRESSGSGQKQPPRKPRHTHMLQSVIAVAVET